VPKALGTNWEHYWVSIEFVSLFFTMINEKNLTMAALENRNGIYRVKFFLPVKATLVR